MTPITQSQRKRDVAPTLVITLTLWVVALGMLLTGVTALANTLLRYDPWTTLEYQIIPNAVCPGQETGVRLSARIDPVPLGTIDTIATHSRWLNLETGQRIPLAPDEVDFNGEYGAFNIESSFVRFAPPEPGVWALEVYYVVTGTQSLRIAEQVTTPFVSEPVTVSDRCSE